LLGLHFKHLVDIAKTRRSNWDAVFEKQKVATGTGASENRRSYRCQMFLSAATYKPDTGYTCHQFMDMLMTNCTDRLGAEPRDVPRMLRKGFGTSTTRNDNLVDFGLRGRIRRGIGSYHDGRRKKDCGK